MNIDISRHKNFGHSDICGIRIRFGLHYGTQLKLDLGMYLNDSQEDRLNFVIPEMLLQI